MQRICAGCGKSFRLIRLRSPAQRFCSRLCANRDPVHREAVSAGAKLAWSDGRRQPGPGKPKGSPPTAGSFQAGEAHRNWRGDDIQYRAAHQRIGAARGTPRLCETCGTTEGKKFEWALRHDAAKIMTQRGGQYDGLKYSPDPNDYIRLCVRCHDSYDAGVPTVCPQCRTTFITTRHDQKFCTKRCTRNFHNALR